jgi:hypothetical protein
MGNDHNPIVFTLQGSTVSSMPLGVALVGSINLLQLLLHLSHAYKPFNDFAYCLHHLEMPPHHFLSFVAHCTHS